MARLDAVVGSNILKNSVAWLKYVIQFDEYYTPPPALVSETTVTSAIGTPCAAFHYVYYQFAKQICRQLRRSSMAIPGCAPKAEHECTHG
jgi:hypothetical protein